MSFKDAVKIECKLNPERAREILDVVREYCKDSLTLELEDSRRRNIDLKVNNNALTGELLEARDRIDAFKDMMEAMQDEHNSEVARLNRVLDERNERIAELHQIIDDLRQELEEYRSGLTADAITI